MTKFDVDSDMVRKLATLLEETGLNEIEYGEGERRIRVTRSLPMASQAVHVTTTPVGLTAAPGAIASETLGNIHANAVTSPMVGTAYLASQPGATPFVKIGDTVKAGDTLLIIEAMKVMNPIKSTTAGIVKEILVTDGKPIEFGEALMIIV